MLAAPLANLRFSAANAPNLQPGEIKQLSIVGDLPDGTTLTLDPSQFTESSSDPTVAQVSRDGSVLGVSSGDAVVIFDLGSGRQLAVALRVGAADTRELEFFPTSYVLSIGDTRQFIVRERLDVSVENRSAASAGSRYFVSDPGVATITADGLLTAVRTGEVTVSTINGGQSVTARIVITVPSANGTTVGAAGGIVANGDYAVGVPSGSLVARAGDGHASRPGGDADRDA